MDNDDKLVDFDIYFYEFIKAKDIPVKFIC